jgi:hypothetical protein
LHHGDGLTILLFHDATIHNLTIHVPRHVFIFHLLEFGTPHGRARDAARNPRPRF